MTESVRRRKSKWDLKEDPHPFQNETRPGNAWSGRGSVQEGESYKSDRNDMSQSRMTFDDRSYSMSMSPGLDGWRQQGRSRSPKGGWSKSHRSRSRSRSRGRSRSRSRSMSRSRSPTHGYRRELENDRRVNGSGFSAPPCNDFAVGRCRRGSECRFLHQDNHDHNGRRYSGSSPRDNWGRRHERGGSSGNANSEEKVDYSRDKLPHGDYDRDLDNDESSRNNRSAALCESYLRGKCYRGSSCRYPHHATSSDVHGIRERAHDRRDTSASYGNDYRREPRRINNTLCKYFASGNCRNGESCRFSHDSALHGSPERRSRDDRHDHDLDHENRPWGGPKWSEKVSDSTYDGPEERGRGKWGSNMIDENRPWGGPKWNDPVDTGIVKASWGNDNDSGNMHALESRSIDDRRNERLDNEGRPWRGSTWSDKPTDQDPRKSPQSLNANSGAITSAQESSGSMAVLNSASAPFTGAREQYPQFIDEGMRRSHDSYSQNSNGSNLQTFNMSITKEFSGHAASVVPTLSENIYKNEVTHSANPQNEVSFSADIVPVAGQSFNQNGPSFDPRLLSSYNMNGRSQQVPPTPELNAQQYVSQPSSNHLQTMPHQGESFTKPEVDRNIAQVTSGTPVAQSRVTSEQVAKLTNLSASLAQIFGNGQQLPQLYAALNAQNPSALVPVAQPNSAGPTVQVVAPLNQPVQATQSQKQYDPIIDSIELNKTDTGNHNPRFSANPTDQNGAAGGGSQAPLKPIDPSSVTSKPNGGDSVKIPSSSVKEYESQEPRQLEQVADKNTADESNKEHHTSGEVEVDILVDGGKKSKEGVDEEGKKSKEGVDEEGKKSKEAKGMRMFKFALVDFVKDLLKPTWKEGQLSKEAHKTIVKKVVDKVSGSIQGAQIPQTQEKIDTYLSYSKPKLSKLVQAYVEKYLKS